MTPPSGAAGHHTALVTVAVGAVAMSGLAMVFAAILDNVVDGDGIAAIDGPLTRWVAGHRYHGLTTAMITLTRLGDPLIIIGVMAVVAAAVAGLTRTVAPLGIGMLGVAGFLLAVVAVKFAVGRPRPELPHPVAAVDGSSFPSGHSTGVCVVAIISAWLLTRWCVRSRAGQVAVWTIALTAVAGVGFSRVYLGVHYLSDVLAGWVLGALWAGVAIGATRLWEARPSPRSPALAVRGRDDQGAPGGDIES
ncbi:phosphatase PAP2 family protein [Nocardia sp. NBC_01503]|uniref:phosphatase PAP2 family protein n=1 Tax=Nocardia sp. NBC_01503 TaxID=2975997 RepID=UPI002E7B8163|nr:phosphatase PAP2 family protein [Nocardia sp. NBC_01503]WTL32580.1 phosphatase PAP2 family protein [Nocardia sp. NBC_01503]